MIDIPGCISGHNAGEKKTHLKISGRMNEKENEAANLCKIRTSVLYADSVFGPTCLEIFSNHVRLTSL